MKLTSKIAAHKKRHHSHGTGPSVSDRKNRWFTWRHSARLALGLLVTAATTLALLEFFIWNDIPPALVGNWMVQDGPQSGGTFDFSRTGNLVVHIKNQRNEYNLKARAVVAGKTLVTTTRNPQKQQEETHTSTILELTAHTLALEFENGEVLVMVRQK